MEIGIAKNSHYTLHNIFFIPRQKRMNKQLKKNMKWKKSKKPIPEVVWEWTKEVSESVSWG